MQFPVCWNAGSHPASQVEGALRNVGINTLKQPRLLKFICQAYAPTARKRVSPHPGCQEDNNPSTVNSIAIWISYLIIKVWQPRRTLALDGPNVKRNRTLQPNAVGLYRFCERLRQDFVNKLDGTLPPNAIELCRRARQDFVAEGSRTSSPNAIGLYCRTQLQDFACSRTRQDFVTELDKSLLAERDRTLSSNTIGLCCRTRQDFVAVGSTTKYILVLSTSAAKSYRESSATNSIYL